MLSGQKQRLKQERDKYKENTETLIAGIHEYQIDSVKRAVEVGRLQFTVSELKKERSEYLEEINQLNFKVKQLQSMSVHKAEIDIPVNINIKDYKTDMLDGKPVSILASDKFKTVDISI